MSTSVKHIRNDMRGAPQISGTVGTLIAALDALFVTGWGPTTALSVNVASGVATATLTPGETFNRDAVVLVAGATPAALNGESCVLSTSSTSITWATTAPDGVATGAITIKYAPQTSWQKVFASTNKAVYRSNHVQANGHYLRVDDTGATAARVRGFETMTDVDTGIGPFPTDAQGNGGGYWFKSGTASAAGNKYILFCDERFLFVCISPYFYNSASNVLSGARGFGDPIPMANSGDAWGTIVNAMGNAAQTGVGTLAGGGNYNTGTDSVMAAARGISGLGGAVLERVAPFAGQDTSYSGNDTTMGTFPSEVDGQLKLVPLYARQPEAGRPPRSIIPGVYYSPQSNVASAVATDDKLAGSGSLAGRTLLALGTGNLVAGVASGVYFVDLTGPWR